jgi:hypothetical protein
MTLESIKAPLRKFKPEWFKQWRRRAMNWSEIRDTERLMRRYMDNFLSGQIAAFPAIPKKNVGEKIIWQLWWQGIDEKTPPVVRACLDSVERNRGDYTVVMLNKDNLREYLDFPDFIWEKAESPFRLSQLSDLVRLYLLSAYGGVWIDATVYLSAPIDAALLRQGFFAFQRSTKPPKDWKAWEAYNLAYFSWDTKFPIRLLNSFMIASRNNRLVGDLLSILVSYWKNEIYPGNYFFFQILFFLTINNPRWSSENCAVTNDIDAHRLQYHAHDVFSQSLWDQITARSSVHKLTYFSQVSPNSFLDVLLRQATGRAWKAG